MVTLSDDDREILDALRDGNRGVDAVAEELDRDPDDVEDGLETLHDNGLVHSKGDGWALTRDGHHLLAAPGDGSADDRIDTPEEVEATIQTFQIRPDRADAIRGAYAYLRHWDAATADEIAADVYDEHPAGYPDPDEWWDQFVGQYLPELPGIERPEDGDEWRHVGAETAGDGGTAAEAPRAGAGRQDGREVDLDEATDPRGGLKHALETLDATEDERDAVVAAASLLRERGAATEDELAATVHDRHDAGYETPEALWEGCLRPAFESLPEIERRSERRWHHAGAETGPDAETGDDDRNADSATGDDDRSADAASEMDDDTCPVCGEPSAGRSVHLGGETIVPARRRRSCVRATPTDGAVAITIYYHGDERE